MNYEKLERILTPDEREDRRRNPAVQRWVEEILVENSFNPIFGSKILREMRALQALYIYGAISEQELKDLTPCATTGGFSELLAEQKLLKIETEQLAEQVDGHDKALGRLRERDEELADRINKLARFARRQYAAVQEIDERVVNTEQITQRLELEATKELRFGKIVLWHK